MKTTTQWTARPNKPGSTWDVFAGDGRLVAAVDSEYDARRIASAVNTLPELLAIISRLANSEPHNLTQMRIRVEEARKTLARGRKVKP